MGVTISDRNIMIRLLPELLKSDRHCFCFNMLVMNLNLIVLEIVLEYANELNQMVEVLYALYYVSDELRSDREIVLEAVKSDVSALCYVSDEF